MAWLINRPDSPYWFACWKRPGSDVPVKRSTKCRDKAKAKEIADLWHKLDAKEITAARALQVIDEIRGGNTAQVTVEKHCARWLNGNAKSWKPATLIFYRKVVDSFLDHLGPKRTMPLTHLSRAFIIAWRDGMAERVTPQTTNNRLKGLRSVLKGAVLDGLLDHNPADQVPTLRAAGRTARDRFTEEQLRAVLNAATGDWHGLVLLGAYTGQRLGDVASLKWPDIDLKESVIYFDTAKTGAKLVVPLAPPLRRYLEGLTPAGGYIHPALQAKIGKDGETKILSMEFADILAAAGLRAPRDKSKRKRKDGRDGQREVNALTFHSLRHTANSFLMEAGVPDAVVRAIIGHSSAAMSARYTHVGLAALRDAAARMPDVTA